MLQQAKLFAQTTQHTIEIADGHLSIQGIEQTLSLEEAIQLLEVLLIWRYGLEKISADDWGD